MCYRNAFCVEFGLGLYEYLIYRKPVAFGGLYTVPDIYHINFSVAFVFTAVYSFYLGDCHHIDDSSVHIILDRHRFGFAKCSLNANSQPN